MERDRRRSCAVGILRLRSAPLRMTDCARLRPPPQNQILRPRDLSLLPPNFYFLVSGDVVDLSEANTRAASDSRNNGGVIAGLKVGHDG